ncbi:MAG: site-specific integrase [Eubacteriales bacterium]|nr:site-specific integrase [Eubacteriales bacterium]
MPAYKDESKGTWYASFYYENWKGERTKKMKRGFKTKKEAQEWERQFLLQKAADMTMNFERFVDIYMDDKKKRLKENTWLTKEHIVRTKIVPYFGKKRVCDIKPRDVIEWQNEMLSYRDENDKPYSQTYLKTVHNQLSAILNHAVRYYGLQSNAAQKAGGMGSEQHKEMLFWTKEEYLKFAEEMMDKPASYYAFELLYWCGIREGELLALTPADFDFEKGILSINKSYAKDEMPVWISKKITEALRLLGWKEIGSRKFKTYGSQKAWEKPDDLTTDQEGFLVVNEQMEIPFT